MRPIRQSVSSSVVFAVHFLVLFIEEKEECLCEDHVCLSPRISVHLKISCITHQDISLDKTGALCARLEDVPERQKEPCVHALKMRQINVCQSARCGDRGHVVIQTLH